MVERKVRPPQPEGKFVLIAHEIGTDRYILADLNGNLIECDEEKLSQQHRYHETLASFQTLKNALWRKGARRVELHPGPTSRVERFVNQDIRNIITGAVKKLGFPPKKRVKFYSVPQEIVAKFNWVPGKGWSRF